jgi:hypothetical protein
MNMHLLGAMPIANDNYVAFTFFIGTMAMMAASVFFFFELNNVEKKWRTSILVSGLITFIAAVAQMQLNTGQQHGSVVLKHFAQKEKQAATYWMPSIQGVLLFCSCRPGQSSTLPDHCQPHLPLLSVQHKQLKMTLDGSTSFAGLLAGHGLPLRSFTLTTLRSQQHTGVWNIGSG